MKKRRSKRLKKTLRKKIFLVATVLGFLSATVVGLFLHALFVAGTAQTEHLYLRQDTDMEILADTLLQRKVIASKFFFRVAKKLKRAEIAKKGYYKFPQGTTINEIINRVRSRLQTDVVISFPQLRKLSSLARTLDRQLLCDSAALMEAIYKYADSQNRDSFDRETILGMFIPNSYSVKWTLSPDELVERMNREYHKFWGDERRKKAAAIGLTVMETITLASIIQEETGIKKDLPIIAGVYINRLKRNIKLQSCPTLKYALKDWSLRRILNKHMRVNSKYNTYIHKGLPPGPITIAKPEAIDAVLNYTRHSFLYFAAKEDFSGEHNFASTYKEHLANAKKYHKELNKKKIY